VFPYFINVLWLNPFSLDSDLIFTYERGGMKTKVDAFIDIVEVKALYLLSFASCILTRVLLRKERNGGKLFLYQESPSSYS